MDYGKNFVLIIFVITLDYCSFFLAFATFRLVVLEVQYGKR